MDSGSERLAAASDAEDSQASATESGPDSADRFDAAAAATYDIEELFHGRPPSESQETLPWQACAVEAGVAAAGQLGVPSGSWEVSGSSSSNDSLDKGDCAHGRVAGNTQARSRPAAPPASESAASSRSRSRSPGPARADKPWAARVGLGAVTPKRPPTPRGCSWWHSTLWNSLATMRQQLPAEPCSPYFTEHLCVGAGTDFLAQEAKRHCKLSRPSQCALTSHPDASAIGLFPTSNSNVER